MKYKEMCSINDLNANFTTFTIISNVMKSSVKNLYFCYIYLCIFPSPLRSFFFFFLECHATLPSKNRPFLWEIVAWHPKKKATKETTSFPE